MGNTITLPEEDAKELLILGISEELDGYSLKREYVVKLFDLIYPQLSQNTRFTMLQRLKELLYAYIETEPPNMLEVYWRNFLDRLYTIEYEFYTTEHTNGQEN